MDSYRGHISPDRMEQNNQIIRVAEVSSTNALLLSMIQGGEELPQLLSVIADSQTQGRGQRGNSWEAEPMANLTTSILFWADQLPAKEQFVISEWVSVAVWRTVHALIGDEYGDLLRIKWSNDIYYADSKIGGILIEHSLKKNVVDYSVIGLGLNLNQEVFSSFLPNPSSLKLITGQTYSPLEVLGNLLHQLRGLLDTLHHRPEVLHQDYLQLLYRREGYHLYEDALHGRFWARVRDVMPMGNIVLETESGDERCYWFKEVNFVIDK